MKQIVSLMAAGTLLLGGSLVYAGDACCAGHSDACKGDKAMGCSQDTLSKLNLTDDQKSKIATLKADCAKECAKNGTQNGCSPEARDKFTKGIKEILTPDQFAQWQQTCQKMSKESSPAMENRSKTNL